jgi:2-polyprenyl-3-methyl-5-hydroxy-6-metoxy-1,4-benzoquinol methylase
LRKLGYELRPLHLYGAANSIEYNTLKYADAFYNNQQQYDDYVKNSVSVHIKNLFYLFDNKHLDLTNKKVVDVGCGTGHCLKKLNACFKDVQLKGTEFSATALKLATEVATGIPICELDISKSALPEVFDWVLCQQVLEHIPDYEAAIRHLWQMTAVGGYLLLTVPDGRLDSFAGHIHFWSIDGFSLMLQKVLKPKEIEISHLQDGLSIYALLRK